VSGHVPRAHQQGGDGGASCDDVHGIIGTIDPHACAGVHDDIDIDEHGYAASMPPLASTDEALQVIADEEDVVKV
jgi:hypothetical protein